MKLSLILCITAVGCVPRPVPPTPPQVVEITRVAIPKPVEVAPPEPVVEPVHTWITGDELKALQEAREEEAIRFYGLCRKGDPLCSDLDGVNP